MAGPSYAANRRPSAYEQENMTTAADVPEPEVAEEDPFPRFVGGGFYELSDGTRIQGKKKATKAQQKLI